MPSDSYLVNRSKTCLQTHPLFVGNSYLVNRKTPQNSSIICWKFIPCKQVKKTPQNSSILHQKFIPPKSIPL
jgi:hypothetical protein